MTDGKAIDSLEKRRKSVVGARLVDDLEGRTRRPGIGGCGHRAGRGDKHPIQLARMDSLQARANGPRGRAQESRSERFLVGRNP